MFLKNGPNLLMFFLDFLKKKGFALRPDDHVCLQRPCDVTYLCVESSCCSLAKVHMGLPVCMCASSNFKFLLFLKSKNVYLARCFSFSPRVSCSFFLPLLCIAILLLSLFSARVCSSHFHVNKHAFFVLYQK